MKKGRVLNAVMAITFVCSQSVVMAVEPANSQKQPGMTEKVQELTEVVEKKATKAVDVTGNFLEEIDDSYNVVDSMTLWTQLMYYKLLISDLKAAIALNEYLGYEEICEQVSNTDIPQEDKESVCRMSPSVYAATPAVLVMFGTAAVAKNTVGSVLSYPFEFVDILKNNVQKSWKNKGVISRVVVAPVRIPVGTVLDVSRAAFSLSFVGKALGLTFSAGIMFYGYHFSMVAVIPKDKVETIIQRAEQKVLDVDKQLGEIYGDSDFLKE